MYFLLHFFPTVLIVSDPDPTSGWNGFGSESEKKLRIWVRNTGEVLPYEKILFGESETYEK